MKCYEICLIHVENMGEKQLKRWSKGIELVLDQIKNNHWRKHVSVADSP